MGTVVKLGENPPTLPEYWDALNRHDWDYQYSEDHARWDAGSRNERLLRAWAERGGPCYKKLWDTFWQYKILPPGDIGRPNKLPTRPKK